MIKHIIYVLALMVVISGCAFKSYDDGERLFDEGKNWLRRGSYDRAIEAFSEGLGKRPDRFDMKRELGIAYYHRGNYAQADIWLNAALQLKPGDGKTSLYLGQTYEKQKRYQEALQAYGNFPLVGRFSRYRRLMEAHLYRLRMQALRKDIRDRMNALPNLGPPDGSTVAVWYFRYKKNDQNSDLWYLQKGLTYLLINDLSKVKLITVVERERLQAFVAEMNLGDPGTAPRYGKLLQAETIVTGDYDDLAQAELSVVVLPFQTTPFQEHEELRHSDKQEQFWRIEKELVMKFLTDTMNLKLLPAVERAIREQTPTDSLAAFLAFSKGLHLFDEGNYEDAKREFEKAIETDPNFTDAREMLEDADAQIMLDNLGMTLPELIAGDFQAVEYAQAGFQTLQDSIGQNLTKAPSHSSSEVGRPAKTITVNVDTGP